jgi:hypothetical protein
MRLSKPVVCVCALNWCVGASVVACGGRTGATPPSVGDAAISDAATADAAQRPDASTGLDATSEDVEGVSDAPDVDGAEVSTADVRADTDVVTEAPVFSPPPGTYVSPQSITMTSRTPGAVIYYTVDGTNPTPSSHRYTFPVVVGAPGSTKLLAYAVAPGYLDSPVTWGVYSLSMMTVCEGVVIVGVTPSAGIYNNDFHAGLSATRICDSGTPTICYTLDGSIPAASNGVCFGTSKTYDPSTQIAIDRTVTDPSTGRVTLNAVATESGFMDSQAPSQMYELEVAAPTIVPASGMIATGTAVSWTSITTSASFHYTVDGTQANCASPSTGTGFVTTGIEKAVSVVGCKAGYAPSTAASATYSF